MVLLLYLAGLLAAAQLGRMSALAPVIAGDLRLALPAVALAISLLEIGGALFGVFAGRVATRIGLGRVLCAGMAALAAAGLGGAAIDGVLGLYGWRVLEAAGYLAVIVSAPVLIALHAAPHGTRTQGLALTLWATFVPVGLAVGAAGSAALAASPVGWRGAGVVGGSLAAVLALLLWRLRLPDDAPRRTVAHRVATVTAASVTALSPPSAPATSTATATVIATATEWRRSGDVVALALAFGGFALFEIGLLGLMPTWLVREAGLGAAAAGQWTALASLSAVAGSAVAAWLLRHGDAPRSDRDDGRRADIGDPVVEAGGEPSARARPAGAGIGALRVPVTASIAFPPLLLGLVWATPAGTLPVAAAIALLVAANVLGGVFASLAFAVLPRLAAAPDALVRANGLIAQCGASGSLLGPPAMALCVQWGGWPGAAALGAAVSVAALVLVRRALGAR